MTLHQCRVLRQGIKNIESVLEDKALFDFFASEGLVDFDPNQCRYIVTEKGKATLRSQMYLRFKVWIPITISVLALLVAIFN